MAKLVCYGSNLRKDGIQSRAPSAHNPAVIYITGWQMVFRNGYATIIPKEGKKVPCVVWEISEEELLTMDYYEGYPQFYDRKSTEYGYVYIMNEPYSNNKIYPSLDYVVNIVNGYKEFGIDRKYYIEADEEFKEGDE